MLIKVVLSFEELVDLVHQLAPIRIHIGPDDDVTRCVELENPHDIHLAPDEGLRLEASGRVRYDVLGITFSATISKVQLLIEPRIEERPAGSEEGSPVLLFAIHIEGGSLRLVPSMIDQSIISRVNEVLTPDATKMLWEFPDTLTQSFSLPDRLRPLEAFLIESGAGEVEVTDHDVSFAVKLDADLARKAISD